MRYWQFILLTLTLCIFVLTSCGGGFNIKGGSKPPSPPANINLSTSASGITAQPSSTIILRKISNALRRHKGEVYALFALMFLWIFARGYKSVLKSHPIKLNLFDLGMLKNIQDSATILWDKYRKPKNVYSLDDYRR